MARTTKQLSGGGKDKFFRGLVAAVAGLPQDAAAAVTAELIEQVTDVRVRRETWQALAGAADVAGATPSAVEVTVATPKLGKSRAPTLEPDPGHVPAPEAAFDPFGFSAVALLTRKGKAALAAELETIASASHLHQLATAQHLAVDTTIADAAALRAAIVAGTERRIAERKAAAS